ncbi:class I histocompatibility antigen, F10 alpha chain-like [Eublepharis macularius]|uniref:Class I histocompatibility antigen, F10 alpha chain-like n=1 Tax=Eublepharis macularius TaxID=481883 RepID=A0AA97J863_EUBMA|nr:class I histocompatibility antigen, F10 alpha chain-like [Eublepharis macularius]
MFLYSPQRKNVPSASLQGNGCRDESHGAACSSSCSSNEFTCHNGHCIPTGLACDGIDHCPDDSDEANCTCASDQFACKNGRCIPTGLACDGIDHCPDYSDEAHCSCTSAQFACKNGRCISLSLICDGEDDCRDETDESEDLCAIQGSFVHSLFYFRTAVTKLGQGLLLFMETSYIDGQPITYFDSNSRQVLPRASWMEDSLNNEYWEEQTNSTMYDEGAFRGHLGFLQKRYNQTGGLHTFQCFQGCELTEDQTKRRYFHREAYDGREIKHLSAEAHSKNRKAEEFFYWTHKRIFRPHLDCIKMLKEYLEYGDKVLKRKEPPTVEVTYKKDLETLVCRVYGFYPKEINATWWKNGAVWEQKTLRRGVVPNSDGTYYTWFTIQIDPKEKRRYQCHVEHAAVWGPLAEVLEQPEPPEMKVTHKLGANHLETLTCRIYGFYPKEINAIWKKDGEAWKQNDPWQRHPQLRRDLPDLAQHRDRSRGQGTLPVPRGTCWAPQTYGGTTAGVWPNWPIVGGVLGAAAALLLSAGIIWYISK